MTRTASSTPWLGLALFGVVIGGAGLLAGHSLSHDASGPAAAAAAARGVRAPDAAACPPSRLAGLDPALRNDLRAMLREEVRAALAEQPGAASAADGAEAAAEPTPESLDALEKGRAVVDAALRVGHWTEADATALRALRPRLATAHLEEIYAVLFPALNKGELHVDFAGPPI